jgi:cytochrome c-type biogenesis protein CcmH
MTLLFWFVAWAMTILVLGLLLWPFVMRQEPWEKDEGERALAVYRQQFAELEQDRKNAMLTDEQYEQSKRELERRLLDETGPVEVGPPAQWWPASSRAIVIAITVIVPASSGLLYWTLGNPEAITLPGVPLLASQGRSDYAHQTSEGLDALSERLKKRLEKSPNDGVGWALLARSYVEIGRHADAVLIYEKAMKLLPDDPQLLVDYADALGVVNGRKLAGKSETLVRQALKVDPDNVKALMLAGTVAFDRRDFGQAAQYWERANANLPADAEADVRRELISEIAEAKELSGGKPATAKAVGLPDPSTRSSRQSAAIGGTVSLAPGLARKGVSVSTLFVFARAMNGPAMPVSIVRATNQDLPFTFRLDDSTSPMPSRKLSDVDSVVIVARLSKSGQAMPQSGDLEGMSQPVAPGDSKVTVVIDREIP